MITSMQPLYIGKNCLRAHCQSLRTAHLFLQVLAEYWSFLPSEEIQSAFPNKRVFVNGLLAKPEMILSQQDTLGLLIHRHEPEVSTKLLVVQVPLFSLLRQRGMM